MAFYRWKQRKMWHSEADMTGGDERSWWGVVVWRVTLFIKMEHFTVASTGMAKEQSHCACTLCMSWEKQRSHSNAWTCSDIIREWLRTRRTYVRSPFFFNFYNSQSSDGNQTWIRNILKIWAIFFIKLCHFSTRLTIWKVQQQSKYLFE